SGTSTALPVPKPTCPFLSPTPTNAAKRKRHPPLTTLATRLIVTTRSSISSLFGSMIVCIYVPPLSITIQYMPHEQHLRLPLHVHDIDSIHDQTHLFYNLSLGHFLQSIHRLV